MNTDLIYAGNNIPIYEVIIDKLRRKLIEFIDAMLAWNIEAVADPNYADIALTPAKLYGKFISYAFTRFPPPDENLTGALYISICYHLNALINHLPLTDNLVEAAANLRGMLTIESCQQLVDRIIVDCANFRPGIASNTPKLIFDKVETNILCRNTAGAFVPLPRGVALFDTGNGSSTYIQREVIARFPDLGIEFKELNNRLRISHYNQRLLVQVNASRETRGLEALLELVIDNHEEYLQDLSLYRNNLLGQITTINIMINDVATIQAMLMQSTAEKLRSTINKLDNLTEYLNTGKITVSGGPTGTILSTNHIVLTYKIADCFGGDTWVQPIGNIPWLVPTDAAQLAGSGILFGTQDMERLASHGVVFS